MAHVYAEIFQSDDNRFYVNLETFIIIYLNTTCENVAAVNFVKVLEKATCFAYKIDLNKLSYKFVNVSDINAHCVLPLLKQNNVEISGLCSVARHIVKCSQNVAIRKLLGFREACLLACNESSIWTKFCEIDMIRTVKTLRNSVATSCNDALRIPIDFTKFERHLEQPVRIHNVYKVARQQTNEIIESSVPVERLNLNHKYGEGPFMTLADVLLVPCIYIVHRMLGDNVFSTYLPLVTQWYKNMLSQSVVRINIDILQDLELEDINYFSSVNVQQDNVLNQSLYISDPNRYKPRNRIYTKQVDIENALRVINSSAINICNSDVPYGFETNFSWDVVPLDANPQGGALPQSRSKRKSEQLETMAKAAIKLAKANETIVDFCSGSGHLGILLAVLLPKCKIILLENKEKSLARAKETVKLLSLTNVTLLQCNLDYFDADFNIGVSLHACGVATDLVIQHCLKRSANFVSCPCCYGGVHNCHHLTYPRSSTFRNVGLSLHDYLVLGHSADQTHDVDNSKTVQGFRCMDVIDTDRKLFVEETGVYEVFLGKLQPHSCTPKNNVLVGVVKN